MKKILSFITMVSAVCLSLSCESTNHQADTRPRFHEAATANVILKFNSWDSIFMMQPIYRDDGFLHHIKRDEVGTAVDRFGVGRDLAVVIIGPNYDPQLPELLVAWRAVLATHGFRRAVCVRANLKSEIDGAVIVDDSQLSQPTIASKREQPISEPLEQTASSRQFTRAEAAPTASSSAPPRSTPLQPTQ